MQERKKLAIISGANGNLGKAIVQQFLNESYTVIGFVHHLSEENNIENYSEIKVDLRDDVAARNAVDTIIEQYRYIDTIVLAAGGFTTGNIQNTAISDIEQQFQLNFTTAYNVVRPVLREMQNQEAGKIFFIGSVAGMDTNKGNGVTAYSLTKSLLFQLANIINAESAKNNVQVHVVVPGIIDTPQNRTSMPKADFNQWEKPEQIAAIISKYNQLEKNNVSPTALVISEEKIKL